ncbi:MAG: cache domain-containing protein [Pirellulales bacterium]
MRVRRLIDKALRRQAEVGSAGADASRRPRPPHGFPRGPWAAFLLLAAVIGAAGYRFFMQEEAALHQAAEEELSAVADSKVAQIADWYRERLADARVLLNTPMVHAKAREFLTGSASPETRRDLAAWMKSMQEQCGYRAVILSGKDGAFRIDTSAEAGSASPREDADFRNALRANEVLATDLHGGGATGGRRHLNLWIPVRDDPDAGSRELGAFLLEIDPHHFLYPMIQTWPTASCTAETLLVRRDGDHVLYLNELRHRKNTALSLRLPIDRPESPAACAVLGREGVMEGVDYRGVPVLAALRRVPGTPWFVVAKIDQEEIRAPLRERAAAVGAFVLACLLAVGLGVNLLWRHRDIATSNTCEINWPPNARISSSWTRPGATWRSTPRPCWRPTRPWRRLARPPRRPPAPRANSWPT